jgi:putative copper export protein
MADIRVERKKTGHTWLWIVLAVVVLIVAVVLLDRAGYINLPFRLGSDIVTPALEYSVAGVRAALMQEA